MTALRKFVSVLSFFVTLFIVSMRAHYITSDHLARIVGGEVTSGENHPYIIAIKSKKGLCGGSLVSPTCVLTAAHCVQYLSNNEIVIQAGTTTPWKDITERYVSFYRIPRKYSQPYLNLDVAIMKLMRPLQGKDIATIPLNFDEVNDNEMVTISGWGSTLHNKGDEGTDKLRTVNMTLIPWLECAAAYNRILRPMISNKAKPGKVPNITQNMFCAWDDGKDACDGDSGSPVVHNGKQIGLVSWGYSCGEFPGVYTKFSSPPVSEFIKDAIKNFC